MVALAPGDMVLVKAKASGQHHKIADKWKQNPCGDKSNGQSACFQSATWRC